MTTGQEAISHCKLGFGQNSIYYLGRLCRLSNKGVMMTLNTSEASVPAQNLCLIILKIFRNFPPKQNHLNKWSLGN